MKKTNRCAFTLIEVIVALAICASSFILLLSANQASLNRSLRARQGAILELAVESKIAEIRSGIETASSGTLENLPDCSWQATAVSSTDDGLDGAESASRFVNAVRLTSAMERE